MNKIHLPLVQELMKLTVLVFYCKYSCCEYDCESYGIEKKIVVFVDLKFVVTEIDESLIGEKITKIT